MTAPRSEFDAAYFTLLRAQEEHTDLLRYAEFLEAELQRLEAFAAAVNDAADAVPRKMRRPVDATSRNVLEAVGRRRATVLEERRRLPERLTAAQAFVQECEAEVATLRGSR